jgi:hypothetical protein
MSELEIGPTPEDKIRQEQPEGSVNRNQQHQEAVATIIAGRINTRCVLPTMEP